MRRKSQYINAAMVIVSLIIFYSCKKQNLPVKPSSSDFSAMLKMNSAFPPIGGKDTIVVKGGTNGWWVTIPDNNDWVIITKRFGSGDFNLPVTVKPNTTNMTRETTVIINPTFNLPPVSIKVTQTK